MSLYPLNEFKPFSIPTFQKLFFYFVLNPKVTKIKISRLQLCFVWCNLFGTVDENVTLSLFFKYFPRSESSVSFSS